MFHTPQHDKMVNTRKTAKLVEMEDTKSHVRPSEPPTEHHEEKSIEKFDRRRTFCWEQKSAATEPPLPTAPLPTMPLQPKAHRSVGSKSKRSSSSVAARKAKLELEAAEAKAKIQMNLIDKKLAAEMADLDEECHSQMSSQSSTHTRSQVEKWLETSQHNLNTQPAPDHGLISGAPCLPATGTVDTEGTVKMLASALKDLTAAAASTNNGHNAKLMSRIICNPRDLPTFEGDPMDWLQFKQAYSESTQLCSFTPKENLWRLRKCLRGQAKEAVSALLISATSPEDVMSTLELQFGNPDVILSKIMLNLKKMNPVSQDYIKDIVSFAVKVRNYVVAVSAIGRDEYLVATNVITNVLSKLPTVLLSKWADYSYPLITQGKKPTLNTLSDFLTQEARKANSLALLNTSSLDYNCNNRKRHPEPTSTRSHSHNTVLVQNEEKLDNKCKFCHISKHKLTECKKFIKSLRKQRWAFVKKQRLCYKCLLLQHERETCPAAVCDVDNCGLLHHRLLHYPSTSQNNATTVNVAAELQPGSDGGHQFSGSPQEQQPESVTNINTQTDCKVLLKVVRINLHGPNGTISAVALLDDGSTVSLINSALTSRLGLRGLRDTMRVSGAWNNNELQCETELVRLQLSTSDGNQYELNARSVKELNLPKQNLCLVNCNNFAHLNNLKKYLCIENVKPDLLIGQDNYNLIRPLDARVGRSNEPCATLTLLGWCVHGRVPVTSSRVRHSTLLIQSDVQAAREEEGIILQQLHDEVRNSFTIESMGVSSKPRQNAEDVRATEQLEKSAVLEEGRWHVGLPWRDANCKLPDSEPTALRRLKNVEQKISSNKEYAHRYQERVNHLFDNSFAEEVTDLGKTDKTWYLPHFGVDNPNKKKLRLVFDAAAKSKGLSLNDFLLTGPDLLMSLFGIMLRFREHKVAIAGDIKDMFLRVKILPQCQDALRFVWRDHVSSPIKTYKMTSLIFGASCSPFIAQFIKNKNAQRFQQSMPSAVEAICKQHYMDDYIDSQPDTMTCIKLAQDISKVHQSGGFVICNWLSNKAEVLNNLPNDELATNARKFKIGLQIDGERALGLLWFPDDDTLGFDVSFKRIPEEILNGRRPTKREALRVIMSIFDVYGFLSPFTINGKIILQQTWISKIGWDDSLDDDIYDKWLNWLKVLKLIGGIRLPRCYQSVINTTTTPGPTSYLPAHALPTADCYSNLELHLFSDASTQAMCAVAFWRWTVNNEIKVAFVSSKCRVAPVKPTTVPRLELQAALLAARLAETIQSEHRIKPIRRYFWCDSTTVLQWVRNDKRTYKTFVAHRLGEIDELTNVNEWRYIPTAINVADIATRESYDISVLQCEWFNGPVFLSSKEQSWPADIVQSEPETEKSDFECVSTIQTVSTYLPTVPEPGRFSSWLRLLRSTAAMLKFIDRCRYKILTDDCTLMARAENLLMKYSQAQSFSEELAQIKAGKGVGKQSRLLTLSPVCDEHGILHVNGRIDAAAEISLATKQPVILDGKNYIAKLVVRHYHMKAGHGGQELVVNELKQKYWIIKIRPTVKNVVSNCNFCRIRKIKPVIPQMGNLPAGRMAHNQRPFTHCGVDLFGPMEVTVGRRREKRYGVLFTCLTIRAVHVEIVHSLTTDALLMALRRMAARRGWPGFMYSDNGTNLRGADTELKKSVKELDEEVLKTTASTYGTQWTFIPPVSPHWGGAWERLIRSVKTTLKVILKERAPKDEVLITLLAEVENIVNSRPLSHVSVEPGTKESLTPNHILLGTSSNLPLLGAFDDSDLYLRKQWRKSQALADMFWRRWVREVLPDMIPRQKWSEDGDQQPLRVGDLVFVADPDSPRCVWPRGIIQQVFPGKDGRVRVVAVRTHTGTLKRSVTRVARLPLSTNNE